LSNSKLAEISEVQKTKNRLDKYIENFKKQISIVMNSPQSKDSAARRQLLAAIQQSIESCQNQKAESD